MLAGPWTCRRKLVFPPHVRLMNCSFHLFRYYYYYYYIVVIIKENDTLENKMEELQTFL